MDFHKPGKLKLSNQNAVKCLELFYGLVTSSVLCGEESVQYWPAVESFEVPLLQSLKWMCTDPD